MSCTLFYFIGFAIMFIGYYIYAAGSCENMHIKLNKKLAIYNGLKFGVSSWLGVILCACLLFTSLIMSLDQWIESKLKEK